MKTRIMIIAVILLAVLLTIAIPQFTHANSSDRQSIIFTIGGREVARIQVIDPDSGPEMDIHTTATGNERSSIYLQAFGRSGTPPTGMFVASYETGYPGSISLYVDGDTRLFITDAGVKLAHESGLLFQDRAHRLYRCGDDLCWTDGIRTVNLTR